MEARTSSNERERRSNVCLFVCTAEGERAEEKVEGVREQHDARRPMECLGLFL